MDANPDQQCCSSDRIETKKVTKFLDCGIEEQVLRLHDVVRALQQSLKWSYDTQSRLQTKLYALEHHQHSSSGDCMVRIEDVNRDGNGISGGALNSVDYLD